MTAMRAYVIQHVFIRLASHFVVETRMLFRGDFSIGALDMKGLMVCSHGASASGYEFASY